MAKDYEDDGKIQEALEGYLDAQMAEYEYIHHKAAKPPTPPPGQEFSCDDMEFMEFSRENNATDRTVYRKNSNAGSVFSEKENATDRTFSGKNSNSDRAFSGKESATDRTSSRKENAADRERSGKNSMKRETHERNHADREKYRKTSQDRETPPKKEGSFLENIPFIGTGQKSGRRLGTKRVRRSSLWKKALLGLFLLLLLVGGLWYVLVGAAYDKMRYEEIPALSREKLTAEGVTNILLIGNDSRLSGEDGRSDAMILLSISSPAKKIYMTSLLRDIYVQIPGYGGNRLNAAYAFGGPKLLMDTLEENFGIPINRYVLVNFQAFAGLVDAVGGVDLELTNDEVQLVNGYLDEYNMLEGRAPEADYLDATLSGRIHLNGPQALAYSRNRYIGTDFERTARQRNVLSAVIKKLPKAMATNSGGVIRGLFPNLTTNLTKTEFYRLSLDALKVVSYDLAQITIPLDGTYDNQSIDGMAVLGVDFGSNIAFIRENIYKK